MMSYRKIFITVIVLLIMVLPNMAFADTVLTVTPGLNGLYKSNQAVQLKISVANDGAAMENAVLVVKYDKEDGDYRQNNAIYQKKIKVPANQRVETELLIPGQMETNHLMVYLYSNGTKVASAKIQGTAVGKDFIGISIGEAPLANGLPMWLETSMKNMVTLKYVAPNGVPENPIALGMVDLIVIDSQNVGNLSPDQLSTIHQWVVLGGTLLLSGGAGAAEGQPFADISPVLVNGKKTISGNWNGNRTSTAPVNVAVSTFVEGKKMLVIDDTTLAARRPVGRGMVIYSAVGLEDLQAKDNNVWEALLKYNQDPVMAAKYNYTQDDDQGLLLNASANFPQLQLPSISHLVGVWGLYMLLVAPGMYLLLKKYNRRDWAWLGVPAMAVAIAAIIYYSAPQHKLNGPLGQTLAIVDVLDAEVAEIRADGSYVSPKGGELVLTDVNQGLIMSSAGYNQNQWEQPPIVDYGDRGVKVSFDKVGYLSLRQASSYSIVTDFGYIDGNIKLSGSRLTGKLTNETNMNIEKCLLSFGDNVVEVGKIPTNGTVNIDVDVMTAKQFNWDTYIKDWFGGSDDTLNQVHDAIETKDTNNTVDNKGIRLIALTKAAPGLMQLQNNNAENINSALIMQRLPLILPKNGKFRLPSGFIPANIVDSDGSLEHTPEGYVIHGGQVTAEFNLQLPLQNQQLDVQTVEITNLAADSNSKLSIFDWTNNKWVEIKPNQRRLAEAELKPFISEQNCLRLHIQKSEDQFDVMPIPGLTVEGVVK